MDNLNSRPTLVPPVVPADFDANAGTSKADLARAILSLLSGSTIAGIVSEQPSPYDLGALTSQVNRIQDSVDSLLQRTIRRITLAGVNNGVAIVPFLDIGTTNYQVDVAFLTPNENFDPIQWSIIENTKTTSQVSLRLDGQVGAFTIEVTITSMEGI